MIIDESHLIIFRILISLIILMYSCVTNWRTLRGPNFLWFIMGGCGLIAVVLDIGNNGFDVNYLLWVLAQIAIVYIIVFILYRLGAFGGAIAKSLIALAILFPVYPMFTLAGMSFPIVDNALSPIFALTVLGNSIVITIILPLSIFVYNLFSVPLNELFSDPIRAFMGYKADISVIPGRHLQLLDHYEEYNGTLVRRKTLRGKRPDDATMAELLLWHGAGLIPDKVWVSPIIPFLILITAGLVAGIIYGDIVAQAISALAGLL